MTPDDARRLFANHPAGRHILTTNGLVYDWVHYRHNQSGIAELIDNNHCFTPFSERLQEDGKVLVHIRCWDFDIDMIEVLDETTGKYHKMWSTDPAYTGGLSRWEHRLYREYLKADCRGSARQKARIAAKSKQDRLRKFDDELWKMGMRDRSKAAALMDAEQARADELTRATAVRDAGEETAAERTWSMNPTGANRHDLPIPPPQSRGSVKRRKRTHEPPRRAEDYGTASTAPLTRAGSGSASAGEPSPKQYRFTDRRPTNG